MHRRDTYQAPDKPNTASVRTRIAIGVVVASSMTALTGVTSVIASAQDETSGHGANRATAWNPAHAHRTVAQIRMRLRHAHRRPSSTVAEVHATSVAAPRSAAAAHRATVTAAPSTRTAPSTTNAPSRTSAATPTWSPSMVRSASAAPSITVSDSAAAHSATPSPLATAAAATASPLAPAATPTAGRLFAASSPWNTVIPSDAATDPASSGIVASVLNNRSLVMNLEIGAYGIPFYTATAATPRIMLGGRNPIGAIPVDPSWRPNQGGDHKMNVLDPSTGTVYELQGYDPSARTVYWAVKRDVTTSLGDGYPQDGIAGPTGSGLTQAGGVIRLSEIAAGHIDHALSFLTSTPTRGYRYPASASDGTASSGLAEGMRIQLDPTLDVDAIPGITPGEKAIAKALQRYGAYCTDNGGGNDQAMGFYVEQPKAGEANPLPAAGFAQDWAQLPHIPRDRLRVLAASVTPRP